MDTQTILVRIHGHVQGVWYRGWTIQQATRLGLTGWVRNRLDGTVEALFHGPTPRVAQMLDSCRTGPDLAHVTKLLTTPWSGSIPVDFYQEKTC